MTREDVMSTPIFDQLLRETTTRAQPRALVPQPGEPAGATARAEQPRRGARRRHLAEQPRWVT